MIILYCKDISYEKEQCSNPICYCLYEAMQRYAWKSYFSFQREYILPVTIISKHTIYRFIIMQVQSNVLKNYPIEWVCQMYYYYGVIRILETVFIKKEANMLQMLQITNLRVAKYKII